MYLVSEKAGVQIEDASVSNQELCATQNATIVYIIARRKTLQATFTILKTLLVMCDSTPIFTVHKA